MQGPFADRLFRIAFAVAGAYNLAFGLWASIWPLSFFELFQIAPPRYPGIWACLGMVVGVYGFLYWYAAWKLDAAWPIIAVGLLGKVLGPIGMITSFSDEWPRRLGMICVYNDLIWWLPFGLFLIRSTSIGKRIADAAPWWCIAAHTAAYAAIPLVLQPGTLTVPDVPARGQYIAENVTVWSIGWSLWMLSAASLVGFYAWWGSRLVGQAFQPDNPQNNPHVGGNQAEIPSLHLVATAAVVIAALGMVCDCSGESLASLVLVERAQNLGGDLTAFTNVERWFTLLCAGIANGLYTIGGAMLTLVTPDLPRWVRVAMWFTWIAGLAMSVAGVLNHVGGMVVTTAVLFPVFIAWVAWMGLRWRRV